MSTKFPLIIKPYIPRKALAVLDRTKQPCEVCRKRAWFSIYRPEGELKSYRLCRTCRNGVDVLIHPERQYQQA